MVNIGIHYIVTLKLSKQALGGVFASWEWHSEKTQNSQTENCTAFMLPMTAGSRVLAFWLRKSRHFATCQESTYTSKRGRKLASVPNYPPPKNYLICKRTLLDQTEGCSSPASCFS